MRTFARLNIKRLMTNIFQSFNTNELLETIVFGMLEKKAKNIAIIDLTSIPNAISSYYVVCHGSSNTQVEAIAESVGREVSIKLNDRPIHVEGVRLAEWILLDYANVVVHVFQKERRDFYNLEELWADADIRTIPESLTD